MGHGFDEFSVFFGLGCRVQGFRRSYQIRRFPFNKTLMRL